MTRSLVFLFRLLTILLSLTQYLCLSNDQPFTPPDSFHERQLKLEGTAPKSTLVAEIKVIVSPSLKSSSKILLSRHRAARDTLIIGSENTISPSLPLASSQAPSTPETHQAFPSRLTRRELTPYLSGVIVHAFGPGSTKDEGKSLPIRPYNPRVIKARMVLPLEITHAVPVDLRPTNPGPAPPRPTQAPNSSHSILKSATSTTSVTPTTSHSGPSSSAASVPALSRTSSTSASPSETPAPRSAFQQIKSYYDPENRFTPLAVMITIGMIIGFLVSLVAVIKCVCHKKRFANKKDYPEGFPWAEANKPVRSNSQRQGLVSTASFISTRNSVASSLQPSDAHHQTLEDGISPNVEYQLNELGSDIYGYSWAVRALEIDHEVSSPSDEMPSSASTDESSQSRSIEFRPEDDEWDTRSLDEGPCLVRGGQRALLQDSKVFQKFGTS